MMLLPCIVWPWKKVRANNLQAHMNRNVNAKKKKETEATLPQRAKESIVEVAAGLCIR